jgi:hypothetical protein
MTKFYLEGNFAPVRDETTAFDFPALCDPHRPLPWQLGRRRRIG